MFQSLINTLTHPATLPVIGMLVLVLLVFLTLNVVSPGIKPRERQFSDNPMMNALGWLGVVLALPGLVILIAAGWELIVLAVNFPKLTTPAAEIRWHSSIMLAMLAAIGAIFTLVFAFIRSFATERQTRATEEGLITDRINKAIQGLGTEKVIKKQRTDKKGNLTYRKKENGEDDYSQPVMVEVTAPNPEVRIGAIYALERIAQDSDRDHIQIMEILCAYIRENGPCESLEPIDDIQERPSVSTDIQTAITVLARRSEDQRSYEYDKLFRLDLSYTNLSGVNFRSGDFSGALFVRSRLEAAIFRGCKLQGTVFQEALLNHIDWLNADLRGALLDMAILNRPHPRTHGMNETFNMAANIEGINLAGANLLAVDYLGDPDKLNTTFGTKDTILCRNLDYQRRNLIQLQSAVSSAKRRGDQDATRTAEFELSNTGFVSWSTHERRDMTTGHYYEQLLERLGIKGFPFHN